MDSTNFIRIQIIILAIGYCTVGIYKFSAWPINFALVSVQFNKKKSALDGCMLGFWNSGWEIGNIIGLGICNLFLHQLNIKWEGSIFFINIIYLLIGFCVYSFLRNPEGEYE